MSDEFDVFDFMDSAALESDEMPTARILRHQLKIKKQNKLHLQAIDQIIPELPNVGWSYHIVANGKYDYFTFVPHVLRLMDSVNVDFYGSTWTMNRKNITEMVNLFDAGKIKTINLLTGLYFKRREAAVYATVLQAIKQRKQRYCAFKNHAKVLLLGDGKNYITIEGSANFTGNPRLEQYVMTNSQEVYNFHKEWMEQMLDGKSE